MKIVRNLLRTRKLRPGPVMSVAALDAQLDTPVGGFRKAIQDLIVAMRKDRTRVDVAGHRANVALTARSSEIASHSPHSNTYLEELRRLPAMDRAEEFRMAKRYELLRSRAAGELVRAGYEPAVVQTMLAGSLDPRLRQRPEATKARAVDFDYLESCIADLEAMRNLYVEGALHLVLASVHRYRGLGVDSADLIQEGNASLFQAIEGFDWRRDVRFRTYAQYWVNQAVLKTLYNSARTVRIPIWVQKLLGKIRRVQDEARRGGQELSSAEVGARLGIPAERVDWVLGTKRYAVSLDAEFGGDEGSSLAQLLPDAGAESVPDSVREGDLGASIGEAMRDLPDREQSILQRRFGLGGRQPETLGEIAADLGITAERVRQLQNAAIVRLQKPSKLRGLQAFVEQT